MIQISCVVFAGGKSSRMQQDKTLLPFGGYTSLVEYQYQRLQKIFKKVYIVTKNPQKFSFQANFIEEQHTVFAPTAGFVSCFAALKEERFFVLGVDLPFVDLSVIEQLLKEDNTGVDVTVAATKDFTEALCGVYHKSAEKQFQQMLQNNTHKLQKALQALQTHYVTFEEAWKFSNLNTPQEYQKALQLYDIINQKKE